MKKKGFTLIELLATIVILGVIGLITYPSVTNVINESKEKAYNTQIAMIEESAYKWGINNSDRLNTTYNTIISLDELVKEGYIKKNKDGNIIDPRTEEKLEGCVVVSWSNSFSQYEYKYSEECPNPEDSLPPIISMRVPDGTINSSGWATEKFYVNVIGSHLTSYKYCISNAECEPDTVVTGNSGSIYVQTSGTNYVCVKGMNTIGSTETVCNQYKLEEN